MDGTSAFTTHARITELLAQNLQRRKELIREQNALNKVIKEYMEKAGIFVKTVNGWCYKIKVVKKKIKVPAKDKRDRIKTILFEHSFHTWI